MFNLMWDDRVVAGPFPTIAVAKDWVLGRFWRDECAYAGSAFIFRGRLG